MTTNGRAHTWKDLMSAADEFEIPSLNKLCMENLETIPPELSIDASTDRVGHPDQVSQFLDFADGLSYTKSQRKLAHQELVFKLCCEHFTELRGQDAFEKFTEKNPEFLAWLLEHVARHGGDIVG